MMSEDVSSAKRIKLDVINETWMIKSILPDALSQPIKRCHVYIGQITDTKSTSKIIAELSQSLPLQDLNHLKRVHKSKVILCSLSSVQQFLTNKENDDDHGLLSMLRDGTFQSKDLELLKADSELTTSILELYLKECGVNESIISLLSKNIEIVSVATHQPILRWQYINAVSNWPCKFHPNENLERIYDGSLFTNEEKTFHSKMLEICRYICSELNTNTISIAVDPRSNSIIAVGFDETKKNPVMHCSMVLIDSVARTQMGGAWNNVLLDETDSQNVYANVDDESTEQTLVGVSPLIRCLISKRFPNMKFGAERIKNISRDAKEIIESESSTTDGDNLVKYGPYLCTGYDVYLLREPCIMCSMALTHSRTRRIFFQEKQPKGGICSLIKLQSVPALNHHFQVFHISKEETEFLNMK